MSIDRDEKSVELRSTLCFDAQLPLDLFERHALGFGDHGLYPKELEAHHAGKEGENVARRKGGDHPGEECGERGGKDPVGETAEGLTFGAMAVGEYLRDKDPDDSSLADGVGSDEGEDADRHDREMLGEKRPRSRAE